MEELKHPQLKKQQMAIKNYVICVVIFLTMFNNNIFGQSSLLTIVAIEEIDSLSMYVRNTSSDTVIFSLYAQYNIRKKWVMNNYDLFSNVENPNTSLYIINPNEVITLKSKRPTTIYVNNKIKVGKTKCKKCKRILLTGYKKSNDTIRYLNFSNLF
jgi:hypothetical protein